MKKKSEIQGNIYFKRYSWRTYYNSVCVGGGGVAHEGGGGEGRERERKCLTVEEDRLKRI